MPGASLWIIPPLSSTFYALFETLITDTIPSHYSKATTFPFIPHITITSGIDQSIYEARNDPQAWLNSLSLQDHQPKDIRLELRDLEAGHAFFKKLTISVHKDDNLLALAALCRAQAVSGHDHATATKWARDDYLPHLSLMYADMPTEQVQHQLPVVDSTVRDAVRARLSADTAGVVATGGCLVLVDTSRPIHQWTIIAQRQLPGLCWILPAGWKP